MLDKIKQIKYSRLKEEDKFLTKIFSNLTPNVQNTVISYYHNDNIILKYSVKYGNVIYSDINLHNELESYGLTMMEIITIIEKYIKIYLGYENTLPWRSYTKKV